MPRFQMEGWLQDYGFRRVQAEDVAWWAWPEGFPYLALDLRREDQTCVIAEYRDVYPPRLAAGEPKQVVWDPEEPLDTPFDEFRAGLDDLLHDEQHQS